MPATYKVIDPTDYADSFSETEAFALDVLVGLSETNKRLPSKYLYDAEGSRLFVEITQLDEYYPTNCEIEILETHVANIGEYLRGEPFSMVELGAGFGPKNKILLNYFLHENFDFAYVPIDISESATKELMNTCNRELPGLQVTGLVSDYFSGLKWLNKRHDRRNFVLFLGSSIGNFSHVEARTFLRNLWSALKHNDLVLMGFDLKKDIGALLWAYNDSKGVTAKFNLNMLERINRELDGEFKLDKFRHYGTYDVFTGAMVSYLVSLERQSVYIGRIGRAFHFAPWEPIHVEYSYKYLTPDIENLAAETGFLVNTQLFDSRRYFVDSIWQVYKPGTGF